MNVPLSAWEAQRLVDLLHGPVHELHPEPLSIQWDRVAAPFTAPPYLQRVRTEASGCRELARIGDWLRESVGPTYVRKPIGSQTIDITSLHRAVPSGGAMYPYDVLLRSGANLLHYDPWRDELAYVPSESHCLGETSGSTVLVAARPHRNVGKYSWFSYRLTILDVGVAVGRLWRHDMRPVDARLTFLDAGGLSIFSADPTWPIAALTWDQVLPVQILPHITLNHCPRDPAEGMPLPDPMIHLHGSALHDAQKIPCGHSIKQTVVRAPGEGTLKLPFVETIQPSHSDYLRRSSEGRTLSGRQCSAHAMAAVIRAMMQAINDQTVPMEPNGDPLGLLVAVSHVSDVPANLYRVILDTSELLPIGEALPDSTFYDQSLVPDHASFTAFILGDVRPHPYSTGMARYERELLRVGMVTEAACGMAAAYQLSAHPVLGFSSQAFQLPHFAAHLGSQLPQIALLVGPTNNDLSWRIEGLNER